LDVSLGRRGREKDGLAEHVLGGLAAQQARQLKEGGEARVRVFGAIRKG